MGWDGTGWDWLSLNSLTIRSPQSGAKKDTLYNYRESKRLQQADVAKLEKVAREQMEEVAKLEMKQERLTKSLQGKD